MRHRHGVNLRSKLLCPICAEIKKVAAIDDDGTITLSCAHTRGITLPLKPGRVSIENLRSEKGRQQFPLHKELPCQ